MYKIIDLEIVNFALDNYVYIINILDYNSYNRIYNIFVNYM